MHGNNTTIFNTTSNNVLLCLIVFKFIAMIIGVFGNVTVIIITIFFNKEKTATSYLVGNLALADLLVCLTFYPIWMIELIQTTLNIESDQVFFCKFSTSTVWTFMFASILTLLAITVDRYLYIVKPLRYLQVVTLRRVIFAVAAIWITACCLLFIVWYIHVRSYGVDFRSYCHILDSVDYFTVAFCGYLPIILIVLLNIHILSVARRQRKRILAETTVTSIDNSIDESANRMSFVRGFFLAVKEVKTFAIVVAVLIICMLIPTVVKQILTTFYTSAFKQIWVVVLHYELYGINSVVNAFIYGMRDVRYRKAYLHVFFKLFSCQKATQ